MIIYNALLKNGYSLFKLEILEYCELADVIAREQYYIDLLVPEYNLNSIAGSRFGTKHSEEARQKMSESHKGENNPMYGKPRPVGAGSPSVQIEVFDLETRMKTIYPSMSAVAKALNCNESSIRSNIKSSKKPYKNIYMFTYKK
jgi:NUMOD3 motif/NUMOD1 domain